MLALGFEPRHPVGTTLPHSGFIQFAYTSFKVDVLDQFHKGCLAY